MGFAQQSVAADYPLLGAFWTMLWFFLWILWLMLLFRVIGDIFRDHSLGGVGKAGWLIFVIVLPFLGIFVYLIARGRSMNEREVSRAQRNEEAFRSYIRDAAATPGTTDQLARLADLKSEGKITDDEYERAKSKVLT